MKRTPPRLHLHALAVLITLGFAAEASAQSVAQRVHGLDFSPYIDGQDPNYGSIVSETQLRDRMRIVAPYTSWIRTFGVVDGVQEAGRIAHELGLKAAVGAWLGRDLASNEAQIQKLIQLANEGHLDIAIVGSEVLLRNDLSESQLLDYISHVRSAIPSAIPVTTADTYDTLLAHPSLLAAVDVVFANFYPYWQGASIDSAVCSTAEWYHQLETTSGGKPVIVSETGWPSGGNTVGQAVPSPSNAARYFNEFVGWARENGVPFFYFEALDEAWKARYEGPQGEHWGVFDKTGTFKPGMATVFSSAEAPSPTCGGILGGPGSMVARYRLYSNVTKEHHYTTDLNEYTVLGTRGWAQEGAAHRIYTSATPTYGLTPIPLFRLYQGGIRQHLWTTDRNEYEVLGTRGWTQEGVDGYVLPAHVGGVTVPLYRLAYAYLPLHLWTTDANEYTVLASRGWLQEGVVAYVMP